MQKDSPKYIKLCQTAAKARAFRSEKNKRPEVIQKRFWSKVEMKSVDECWPWRAGVCGGGYGAFRMLGRKISASKFSWILTNGPIPEGKEVCHKCDNRICCNPNHLFLGTHQENILDCRDKGRMPRPKGSKHPLHKLTEPEVISIRNWKNAGWTTKQLAEMHGVCNGTIRAIIRREHWTHI